MARAFRNFILFSFITVLLVHSALAIDLGTPTTTYDTSISNFIGGWTYNPVNNSWISHRLGSTAQYYESGWWSGLPTNNNDGYKYYADSTFIDDKFFQLSTQVTEIGCVGVLDYYHNYTTRDCTIETLIGEEAHVITDDGTFIYIGFDNGEVHKFDTALNYIEQVKGSRGAGWFAKYSTDLYYNKIYDNFVERKGDTIIVYNSNYIQIGENHTVGSASRSGLYMNDTHLFQSQNLNLASNSVIKGLELDTSIFSSLTGTTSAFPSGDQIDLSTIYESTPLSVSTATTGESYILFNISVGSPASICQSVLQWDFDYSSYSLLFATCGLTDNGVNDLTYLEYDTRAFQIGRQSNDIYQVDSQTESNGLLKTSYLTGVIIKDYVQIDDKMYVLDNQTKTIRIYNLSQQALGGDTYALNYTYDSSFSLDPQIRYEEVLYMESYNDEIFILDPETLILYQYNTSGAYKNKIQLENWVGNYPADIFFVNDILFVLDPAQDRAIGYSVNLEGTAIDYQGLSLSPVFCLGETEVENPFDCSGLTPCQSLCLNASFSTDETGKLVVNCDANNVQSCPVEVFTGGCTTEVSTSTGFIYGSCESVSCSLQAETCNVNNEITCVSLQSYTQCGQYDTDVCLEVGSVLNCPAGQYCSQGGCSAINLTDNLQSSRSVGAVLVSTTGYDIQLDDDSNTYYVKGVDDSVSVNFNVRGIPTTPAYSASISQYEETQNVRDFLTTTPAVNWGGGLVTLDTDTDGRNFLLIQGNAEVTKTLPTKLNNREIQYEIGVEERGFDLESVVEVNTENNETISAIYYEYESSNGTLKIYRSVGDAPDELILTDDSISDNLLTIYTDVYILDEIDTIYYQFFVKRDIAGQDVTTSYYTNPFAYSNTSIVGHATYVRFTSETTKDIRVYGVVDDSLPNFDSYDRVNGTSIYQEQLQYTETGCFEARIYGSDYFAPTYHFFDEVTICVVELNTGVDPNLQDDLDTITSGDYIERITGQRFSDNTKTTIAIFTIFIIMATGAFLYTESKSNFILVATTVVSGLFLFWFTIIGYIPVWVVLLFGVVGAGIALRIGVNTFAR